MLVIWEARQGVTYIGRIVDRASMCVILTGIEGWYLHLFECAFLIFAGKQARFCPTRF